MNKCRVLSLLSITVFLAFFTQGIVYSVFTPLVFLGVGGLVPVSSTEFYKNIVYGSLITLFPLFEFIGAPIIGKLSDHHGSRKLLIISFIGGITSMLICALGIFYSSLVTLFLGRIVGGIMAGKMTTIYGYLGKFSEKQQKVRNFALIQLAMGLGFSSGPYATRLVTDLPQYFPFLLAAFLSSLNLLMVFLLLPEIFNQTGTKQRLSSFFSGLANLAESFKHPSIRPYLLVLFLVASANLLFIQFVGPFAIENYQISSPQIRSLFVYIGIAFAMGQLFIARPLANYFSPEKVLGWILSVLSCLLVILLISHSLIVLYILTFLIMLTCAIGNTNAMALMSNQERKENQGQIMGIAVSIQCFAEFLPAIIFSFITSFSRSIPLIGAFACAVGSYLILSTLKRKALKELSN